MVSIGAFQYITLNVIGQYQLCGKVYVDITVMLKGVLLWCCHGGVLLGLHGEFSVK